MKPITLEEFSRFNRAARMIEDDGCGGFFTVSEKFGKDIAISLLIAYLRKCLGSCEGKWPPDEEMLDRKIKEVLTKEGLL